MGDENVWNDENIMEWLRRGTPDFDRSRGSAAKPRDDERPEIVIESDDERPEVLIESDEHQASVELDGRQDKSVTLQSYDYLVTPGGIMTAYSLASAIVSELNKLQENKAYGVVFRVVELTPGH